MFKKYVVLLLALISSAALYYSCIASQSYNKSEVITIDSDADVTEEEWNWIRSTSQQDLSNSEDYTDFDEDLLRASAPSCPSIPAQSALGIESQAQPDNQYKKRKLTEIEQPAQKTTIQQPYGEAFFSLKDNLKEKMLSLIRNEKKTILVTMYTFTDAQIAQALIDANNRGVHIEVILDGEQTCLVFAMYALARRIANNGIKMYTFPAHTKLGIMHNKFVLFGDQNGSALLWTGSYNFTKSANERNAENALLLNDPSLIHSYQKQFERLKASGLPSLPTIGDIDCPDCKYPSLKVQTTGSHKSISCTGCTFDHQFINK